MSTDDDGGIEWLTNTEPSQDLVTVDIRGAAAITVGPGEILVVVMPQWATPMVLREHREHFTAVLGNRFVMVAGDNIQLAKVRTDQWAAPALGRISAETLDQTTAQGECSYCGEVALFKPTPDGAWWTHQDAANHRVVIRPESVVPYREENA